MVDDWFSALTILATESDIMDTISVDDIVKKLGGRKVGGEVRKSANWYGIRIGTVTVPIRMP